MQPPLTQDLTRHLASSLLVGMYAKIDISFTSVDLWAFVLSLGAITEGLVHELPSADAFQPPPATEENATTTADDLEELRKQLEALNAD